MAGHTPGPWRAGMWGGYADHAVVVIDQHDEQVATTGDLLKSWGECEANARLISVAPDLLALAQQLAASRLSAKASDYDRLVGLARALVAKAAPQSTSSWA